MAMTPRIVFSPLGKRWYVVTRFKEHRGGVDAKTGERHDYMVASIKYDVTDQMLAILKARGASTSESPWTPERRAAHSKRMKQHAEMRRMMKEGH